MIRIASVVTLCVIALTVQANDSSVANISQSFQSDSVFKTYAPTSSHPGYQVVTPPTSNWDPAISLNNATGSPGISLDRADGAPRISLSRASGSIKSSSGVSASIKSYIDDHSGYHLEWHPSHTEHSYNNSIGATAYIGLKCTQSGSQAPYAVTNHQKCYTDADGYRSCRDDGKIVKYAVCK